MATKRVDFNAVQIRLSDSEIERLDRWIEALRNSRLGGSAVSRTSLLRDLLVAEMSRREITLSKVAQAKLVVQSLQSAEVTAYLDVQKDEAARAIRDAIVLLEWVSSARMHCSALAIRLVDGYEEAGFPQGDDHGGEIVFRAMGVTRVLNAFVHEAEMEFGESA